MFCPTCGQQQAIEETRFCSRCGFLLTGIYEIMANGGVSPNSLTAKNKGNTPRKRGLKQGLFIFLLSFLIVPIIAILTLIADAEPFAVAISAILLSVGGLLRAAYAMMFESSEPSELSSVQNPASFAPPMFGSKINAGALPPQQSIPASAYAPPAQSWRETNDLAAPPASVTDSTTKLLQKDES